METLTEVQLKTFSHDPRAHGQQPEGEFEIKLTEELVVFHPDPELQRLPTFGSLIEDKTFSHDPNAHAIY